MNDLFTDHRRHDPLLIAAGAAGDLDGTDRRRADELLAGCAACAGLGRDLRLLAAAVRDLPPIRRPRDFVLSDGDGRNLRRPAWRRLLGQLRGDAFRLAAPMGAACASLGLAGLLFATVTSGALPGADPGAAAGGGPAAIEAAADARDVATLSGSDAGRPGSGGAAGTPDGPGGQQQAPNEGTGPAAGGSSGEGPSGERQAAAPARGSDAVVVLSGSLFIVGLGLFGLRWTADRLGDG